MNDLIRLTWRDCPDSDICPNIFLTSTGSALIQGTTITDGQQPSVEIPAHLVAEAIENYVALPTTRHATDRASGTGTIDVTGPDTLCVSGNPVDDAHRDQLTIPAHENVVEVAFALLLKEADRARRAAAA